MVKVNGVLMSKGKKRKLEGSKNENVCFQVKRWDSPAFSTYRWREL